MLEWLDGLSLWWYAAGAIFIFAVLWIAYEVAHAPVMEEDEPEQHDHKSANK